MDGAARLLAEHRFQDVSQLNWLLGALVRRVSLLGLLSSARSNGSLSNLAEADGRACSIARVGTPARRRTREPSSV